MTNVFKGPSDARQSDSVDQPVSRFRPTYRALTDEEKQIHDSMKSQAADLEALFDGIENVRYRALALTALEQSVMWAVKGLTS